MDPRPDPSAERTASSPGRGVLISGASLLAVAGVLHARAYDFVADDTFIGLRYVRNLLNGEGLVFNVGERVEGYTNFLWLALLSAAGALGADLLAASRALGYATLVAMIFGVTAASRSLLDPAPRSGARPAERLVPALLLVASAPLACWVPSGMETPGYALLVTLALGLGMRARPAPSLRLWTGWTLGLLALMRPEGLLVGLVVAAFSARSCGRWDRRALLQTGLPFLAIVGLHLAFRRLYYGDFVPNTFHAKVGGPSWAQLVRGIDYVHVFFKQNGGTLLYLGPLVAAFWRRDRAWWLAAAVLATVLGSAALVGGDGLPMYRFCVPALPAWALLAGALLSDGVRALSPAARSSSDAGQAPWVRGAPFAAVVLLAVLSMQGKYKRGRPYALYSDQKDFEIPEWTAAGRWLAANSAPGDSVACVPIGAVGYYSGLTLFDMVGLTDRHIAGLEVEIGEGWAGHEKHDGPYILARRPTFLLLGNVLVDSNPEVIGYRQFARLAVSLFGAREADVFTPTLERLYEPAVADLGEGMYLHYFRLLASAGGDDAR